MRIYAAQLNPTVGDLEGNTQKIINSIQAARKKKADIVLFAEMAICGYPPEDLVYYPSFIDKLEQMLEKIKEASQGLMVVVGLIRKNLTGKGKFLYNTAAIIIDEKIAGFKDKTLLPTYDVFDEIRYFEPGDEQKVFLYKNKKIGITICEDVWQHAKGVEYLQYLRDPVLELKELKPDLVLNLSASPYHFQKKDFRLGIFSSCAKTLNCPFVWCNQVGGNDSLIFDGYSLYVDAKGDLVGLAKGFEEDVLLINLASEKPQIPFPENPYKDLYTALVLGVKDYFQKQGFQKACIGLSGGVDSALVACIAVDALGCENVLAVSMPSRFSSFSSIEDAKSLAKNLKIKLLEIPIDHVFQNFLDLLSPIFCDRPFDATEENIQARIRGMILMGISNKLGHIVLSTGNKSEMAVGYTTLYGDMCGGLGVLNDVSKTNVYVLSKLQNDKKIRIPPNIIKKPPSAELRPNQTDQDSLPEYAVLDGVLSEYIEGHFTVETISQKHDLPYEFVQGLIKKIHLAEYKRRQSPPGLRVTKKAFSKGRMFPIVQKWV